MLARSPPTAPTRTRPPASGNRTPAASNRSFRHSETSQCGARIDQTVAILVVSAWRAEVDREPLDRRFDHRRLLDALCIQERRHAGHVRAGHGRALIRLAVVAI